MKDYIEDKYFLKYQDKIIEKLQFYHEFNKYRILRHYRNKTMENLEFDVLIVTPKLKIGIELKEWPNEYKAFEQALRRLQYVDYQYVLIGFPDEIIFNLRSYLDIVKYYESRLEDLIRIGIFLVSDGLGYVYLFKQAFKKDNSRTILKYLDILKKINDEERVASLKNDDSDLRRLK